MIENDKEDSDKNEITNDDDILALGLTNSHTFTDGKT
jgi:hypothetical protein